MRPPTGNHLAALEAARHCNTKELADLLEDLSEIAYEHLGPTSRCSRVSDLLSEASVLLGRQAREDAAYAARAAALRGPS